MGMHLQNCRAPSELQMLSADGRTAKIYFLRPGTGWDRVMKMIYIRDPLDWPIGFSFSRAQWPQIRHISVSI